MNLIQALMAFIVAYMEGDHPKEDLNVVLTRAVRKSLVDSIPVMANALAAYDAGEDLDWAEMAQGVKDYADEYGRQPSSKSSFHKALLMFAKYYRTGSEPALAQIRKLSSLVDSQFLRVYFSSEAIDQGAVKKELVKIVKTLGGDGPSAGLTQDEGKAAKIADPEKYKAYLSLRKQFTDAWKTELSNFVRASGSTRVPFQKAVKYLQSKGMEHTMPEGFTGMIDAVGGWYTTDGEPINGGAPTSVMFPKVRMNPEPGPDTWVFQAIRPNDEPGNYFYTQDYSKRQTLLKFSKVSDFDIDVTRAKWLGRVKSFKAESMSDPVAVACLVLELLYRTSNRIGTRIGGNPTGGGFGICTLLVAHVRPQSDGSIKFIYLGKDDVKTVALIKKSDDPIAAKLCAAIKLLMANKTAKNSLFTYTLGSGVQKPLQPAVCTKVFQKCCGDPELTCHKIRTAKGTALFNEFMEVVYKKYKTLDSKQALVILKEGGAIVGKELNHVRRSAEGETTVQPMTSLLNYIDVQDQLSFFEHYKLPVPRHLEKFLVDAHLMSLTEDMPWAYVISDYAYKNATKVLGALLQPAI